MSTEENGFSKDSPIPPLIELGDKLIDTSEQTIRSGSEVVRLEPLSFSFLMFLISNHGDTVTREMLLTAVWNNRVVTDDAIRKVVRKLRLVLEDDAKKPKYIKTIPSQGYELIATPKEVHKAPTDKSSNTKQVLPWLLVSLALLFIIFLFDYFHEDTVSSPVTAKQLNVSMLTQLPNNEISASYHAASERLLFLYQEQPSKGFQVYIKNLKTQITKQLTNDDLNYKSVAFSPDGKNIAFTRIDGKRAQLLIAELDSIDGLVNIKEIVSKPEATGLLSWSSDGRFLYTSTFGQNFSSGSRGIYRINVNSQKTEVITFPNLKGGGDFFAKESAKGDLLAVLRMEADRRFRLVIVDLVNQVVSQESAVSFFPYRLIWQGDSTLAISGVKGEFYRYSLKDNIFESLLDEQIDLGDVFFQCGTTCYFMSRHTQNYTNILELDNPYFEKGTKPLIHIDTGGAEFHPTYSPDGNSIVYTAKDQSSAKLILQERNNSPIVLYQAPANTVIKHLSFNAQMTRILGKFETQLFVLDIKTKEMKFITSPLALVNHPNWDLTGDVVYFSREQNNETALYQYHLLEERELKLYDDLVSVSDISTQLTLAIDTNNQMFQLNQDGTREFIIELPNAASDHWQVVNQYLYFTQKGNDNVILYRLNLNNHKLESKLLAINPAWSRFSIDKHSMRLLVTQTLSRQSDLVKVSW